MGFLQGLQIDFLSIFLYKSSDYDSIVFFNRSIGAVLNKCRLIDIQRHNYDLL